MNAKWDPKFFERSAVFAPLHAAAALGTPDWPAPADLQRLLSACSKPVVSGGGAPVCFVPAGAKPTRFEDRFEPRIFLRGEVPVRSRNWHDLFNALAWLTFPLAKAALNARHYAALNAQRAAGERNRGPVQDALTLFDESGLIVAAADGELLDKVEAFAWKDLFWHERARVLADMRFYVFGHALYEKMLAPFPGITGRAIRIEAGRDLLAQPLGEQILRIDAVLAERLRDPGMLRSPRELAPVPVLGVPGWADANRDERYYDDTTQFRPGRTRR